MFKKIKKVYRDMKRRNTLMIDVKKVVTELCGYLSGFVFEGKVFLNKITAETSGKYVPFIHMVNVKCSHATYLKSEIEKMEIKIRVDVKDDDMLKSDFERFAKLTSDICNLIKESVNIVPYSKIDEFYNYTYRVCKYLLTELMNRYYECEA
jgi:hypothetical protein